MTFPPVIKMRRQETVEVIRQTFLKLFATHRGLGDWSFAEYELQVLSKGLAPSLRDKLRLCCVPPTEFHGTRDTSSHVRPCAD